MKKLILLFVSAFVSLNLFSTNIRTVAVFDNTARNAETNFAELDGLKHVLKVAGIPFIITSDVTIATQYPVILTTSKFQDITLTIPEKDSIISFVNNGGTLVVPNLTDSYLFNLFGISSQLQLETRHHLHFETGLGDPSMRWLNDTLEQNISLGRDDIDTVIGTRAFTPTTATVFATYEDGTPAITRNNYGAGKAYALGVSYKYLIIFPQMSLDDESQRTWSNGFEPTSDAWILFVKGICVSAIQNSVWLHTSPWDSKSSLMITHDIDAHTSYDTMHYYADYENSIGSSMFYFCTTHYIADDQMTNYYDATGKANIQYVMNQGHTIGSHSVGHFPDFDNDAIAPMGTLGNTTSTYNPFCTTAGVTTGSTVLGETELSRNLLQADFSVPIRSFRSGYLCNNPLLIRALDSTGYSYNSTYSANDVLTNFPYLDHKYRHSWAPLATTWEFPMTISDVFTSDVITSSNYISKEAIWLDVVTRNTANYAPTVLLIHPTRYYKLFAEQLLINQLPPKVALVNFETFADYWLNRNALDFTSTLSNDTLTIIVPSAFLPLNDKISFVVDNGQSLQLIKAQDDLGNPIAVLQSNWDNNGTLVHFGVYSGVGINENNNGGDKEITANCYPNPFSNSTTIEVWQKNAGALNISIYNLYGQLIKVIANEKRNAGIYSELLDAKGIAPGTYFCKITSGNKTLIKKLMITN